MGRWRLSMEVWRGFLWKGSASHVASLLVLSTLGGFLVTGAIASEALGHKVLTGFEQLEFLTDILLGVWALTFGASAGLMLAVGCALAETVPPGLLKPPKTERGEEKVAALVSPNRGNLPDTSFASGADSTRSPDMGRMTRTVWRFFRWKGTEVLAASFGALGVLGAFATVVVMVPEVFRNRVLSKPDELGFMTKVLVGASVFTFGLSIGGMLGIGRALAETLPPEWLEPHKTDSAPEGNKAPRVPEQEEVSG